MKRLIAMTGALAALGLAALPGSAGAVATPNGGAANMLHDATMGTTMINHVTANGVQGMFCAVDVTNGFITTPVSPGTCPEGG